VLFRSSRLLKTPLKSSEEEYQYNDKVNYF